MTQIGYRSLNAGNKNLKQQDSAFRRSCRVGPIRNWTATVYILGFALLVSLTAFGQVQTSSVAVGYQPRAAAVDPTLNRVYVANFFGDTCCQPKGTVTVVDGATHLTQSIQVGEEPIAMAVNPLSHKIYVIDSAPDFNPAGDLTIIDPNVDTTNVPTTKTVFDFNSWGPQAIALDPITNLVFVANQATNPINGSKATITVWNASSDNFVSTIPVDGAQSFIAMDTARGFAYFSGVALGAPYNTGITKISERNPFSKGPFPQAQVPQPGEFVVDEVTNTLFVTAVGETFGLQPQNQVYVIDGSTLNTKTVLNVGGPGPYSASGNNMEIALNPATHKVYVGSQAGLTVIDGSNTSFPATTITLPSQPEALAINSLTNLIYVTTFIFGNPAVLSVIDGTSDTIISTATITGVGGEGETVVLALNPLTDRLYATSGANFPSNLADVDLAADSVSTVTDNAAENGEDVAVNPVTHKVYIADEYGSNVTVVDPQQNNKIVADITDPNAYEPVSIAVNPILNLVYVANFGTGNVTVIDGNTDSYLTTITDPNARGCWRISVNPVNNKVYVANLQSNNVTVIDSASNQVIATVNAGSTPFALAVNNFASTVTPGQIVHKVYVVNQVSNGTVTEIDGDSNQVTNTIPVGNLPWGIAVNPAPVNQVWVANDTSADVTMFDAETYQTASITDLSAKNPRSVAINSLTNQIYVGNFGTSNVTIIDGNAFGFPFKTVDVGGGPVRLAVNPATGHVYVASFYAGSSISVIDGPSRFVTTLSSPGSAGADAVAVDATTNEVFIANYGASTFATASMSVIAEQQVQNTPLQTVIAPLQDNFSTTLTPTFDLTSSSSFTPFAPAVDNTFFQLDTSEGRWLQASNLGSNAFTAMPSLQPGFHILYAFATDAREASASTSVLSLLGHSTGTYGGNVTAYPFVAGGNLVFPQIASVSPSSGPIGTQIMITGSNFGAAQGSSIVTIGGVNAGTAVSWIGTQIVIDVPFGADMGSNSAAVVVTVNRLASNSVIFTVTQAADLVITGSAAPNPVNAGNNLTYTFGLRNLGPNYASSVTFTDTLPSTVTFVSASLSPSILGSCGQSSGTVTCNLQLAGTIGTATVTIVVTPTAAGSLMNTATVSSSLPDPNPANNTATVITTVNPAAPILVTVNTSPQGPSVSVDGTTYTTAQTFTWSQGSVHSIGTTLTQTDSTGTLFNFTAWSDGGAITHNVTASVSTTYTATFNVAVPVTGQTSITASGLLFNRLTRQFTGTLTITNTSAVAIAGPIQVWFDNLSSGIVLVNASGSFEGFPFISISSGLAPGQSVRVPVRFSDPSLIVPNVNVLVYSGVL